MCPQRTQRNDCFAANVEIEVSQAIPSSKETLMQKWEIIFVDDHGETIAEQFDYAQEPTMEQAAQLIREKLVPLSKELDLNDLEGRTDDPTVKSLKTQNSIEIISIKPVS
jgi:hypothetical protein